MAVAEQESTLRIIAEQSTVLDCSRQSLKKREKSDGCKSDRGSDEGRAYRDVHRPSLVHFIRCSRL